MQMYFYSHKRAGAQAQPLQNKINYTIESNMKFNPKIHHRRSIRLKGYDYSQEGLYFITICCENNICRFGNIENEKMILNDFGQIAHNEWLNLAERFDNFELDTFQIMPNHIHGVISLKIRIVQPAPNDNENSENNSHLEIWAGQAQPLRLPTLLVVINHWWQMSV